MNPIRKTRIEEMQRLDVDSFAKSEKLPLILILDNIRSLNNVGSLFRTADAFRIEALYLCGITGKPPQNEIHKTALGAEETVQWHYFDDVCAAINQAQEKGFQICAIEQAHGSHLLHTFEINTNGKYALILGNEVHGVQEKALELCQHCIEIPQFGSKHSLNVSVAAGIVCWQFANRLSLFHSITQNLK